MLAFARTPCTAHASCTRPAHAEACAGATKASCSLRNFTEAGLLRSSATSSRLLPAALVASTLPPCAISAFSRSMSSAAGGEPECCNPDQFGRCLKTPSSKSRRSKWKEGFLRWELMKPLSPEQVKKVVKKNSSPPKEQDFSEGGAVCVQHKKLLKERYQLNRRIHSRGCTRRPPHGLHGHLPRKLRKKIDDIHNAREPAAGHPFQRNRVRLHFSQGVKIFLLRHNSPRVALRRRVSHQLRHFLRLIIGHHVAVRDPASAIIREAFLMLEDESFQFLGSKARVLGPAGRKQCIHESLGY